MSISNFQDPIPREETLPVPRRLPAKARHGLSGGTKRLWCRAPRERTDGSRRDESLRPVSCCAAWAAWLTRPRAGRPAAGHCAETRRHRARRRGRAVAAAYARPSARRSRPSLRQGFGGSAVALREGGKVAGAIHPRVFPPCVRVAAKQLERFEPAARVATSRHLDARDPTDTSAGHFPGRSVRSRGPLCLSAAHLGGTCRRFRQSDTLGVDRF